MVRIWDLDLAVLLRDRPNRRSAHYSNAKVVLVGNTSTGKTGLGLVLAGRKFQATESTHGRHVSMFEKDEVHLDGGRANTRETLLWDLAGQPGYRLINRLHLHEVAVALVLFDSRSETEPFAGVAYWARSLDEATREFPLVKFLVASRIDRGGPAVSQDRIDEVVQRYGFDGFFQTSAKRGDGVEELRQAIREAIAWDRLPIVSTTDLFEATKTFLMDQKKRGCIVATEADLFGRFRESKKRVGATPDVFTTCLSRIESAGLVRRLSFCAHVLLQPEVLDDYCGWLALAARDQPDGLGFIKEDDVQRGRFPMDAKRRLEGRPEEKTLLLATVQEVVGRNIAHRQVTDRGIMLVFPSELNAEVPDYPGGYSLAVAFQFEGSVSAIYATLAVTLINSIAFRKKKLFKNAALYEGPRNQVCGFAVEFPDRTNDALGRLMVFFEADTQKDVRLLFLRYVNQQLERLAFKDSVQRQRIYHCGECDYTIPQNVVEMRIKRRATTVVCPSCLLHYPIDDLAEQSTVPDARVDALDASAVEERERQERLVVLKERMRHSQFHVFLCHNSKDKPIVRELAQKLRDQGVLPWIDEKGILAGDRFAPVLEGTIDAAGVVAVIIGPQGLGRWQEMEYHAALQRYIEDRDEAGRRRVRVIPILLPGVPREPQLPTFLRGFNFIDLRQHGPDDRDQIRKLVAAILSDGPRF